MSEQKPTRPIFCIDQSCRERQPHAHFDGSLYYGRKDQIHRAWDAARGVKNAELRVIAFEKIHGRILSDDLDRDTQKAFSDE